jgi:hypothetical protein
MMTLSATHPPDLVAELAAVGIEPTLEGPALPEAMLRAIALHGDSCAWKPIHISWAVTLHYPERRTFFGQSLKEALTWCLLWVIAHERKV